MMDKTTFGAIVIIACVALQIAAWQMGKDGAVFAAIFGVIGAIAGGVMGFSIGVKSEQDKTKLDE